MAGVPDKLAVPSPLSTKLNHPGKVVAVRLGVSPTFIKLAHPLDESIAVMGAVEEIIRYDLSEDFSIETALIVAEMYRKDGEWKFKAVTDFMTRENNFRLDEEFSVVWGRNNGIMHSTCTRKKPNVIACVAEERKKGWNFESKMIFSYEGMIAERYFINKDIRMRKYYEKMDKKKLEEGFADYAMDLHANATDAVAASVTQV